MYLIVVVAAKYVPDWNMNSVIFLQKRIDMESVVKILSVDLENTMEGYDI